MKNSHNSSLPVTYSHRCVAITGLLHLSGNTYHCSLSNPLCAKSSHKRWAPREHCKHCSRGLRKPIKLITSRSSVGPISCNEDCFCNAPSCSWFGQQEHLEVLDLRWLLSTCTKSVRSTAKPITSGDCQYPLPTVLSSPFYCVSNTEWRNRWGRAVGTAGSACREAELPVNKQVGWFSTVFVRICLCCSAALLSQYITCNSLLYSEYMSSCYPEENYGQIS